MNKKDPCKGCNSYTIDCTRKDTVEEKRLCVYVQDCRVENNSEFFNNCPCKSCLVKSICDRERKLEWSCYSYEGQEGNYFFCEIFFSYLYEHVFEDYPYEEYTYKDALTENINKAGNK